MDANECTIDILNEFGLIENSEHEFIECKEAANRLPSSFWETYSAFANTEGGIVLLGIKELKEEKRFVVTGVINPEDVKKTLWDTVSNKTKVNRCVLSNADVQIVKDISGKNVVIVYIQQASAKEKPIFLNHNQANTYIRRGEGDVRASDDELNAFIRNSSNTSQDAQILKNYSLNDMDKISLIEFRSKVSVHLPSQNYEEIPLEDFLIKTGFFGRDIASGKYILHLVAFFFLVSIM